MKKQFLFCLLIFAFSGYVNAQSTGNAFDSIHFSKNLELADYLIECEYYTQLAKDHFSRDEDVSNLDWFSLKADNHWFTVGGKCSGSTFAETRHVTFDTLYNVLENSGNLDTTLLHAYGSALALANIQFQLIRDTCNLYFDSYIVPKSDHTLSVWFLPAFQPSGQAIYGCEWEYITDKTGKTLLSQNTFTNKMTGVWIGQPRELWLNYRNTDKPTPGSVFFAEYFRGYFTRIRIDTLISTSTLAKESSGNYVWTHKMK